jgi:glyoxylase-like metal-dependent hydrolase (beta-lactamase superfamily II)
MAAMRRLMLFAVVSWLAVTGPPAGAAPAPLPRMTRLAGGVYMYEHVDPTKAGVTANNLVVIGTEAVLVADGQGTPANTADLLSTIAALTPLPIRYVVVGSEHGDHRGGDSAFPRTTTFLAHPSSQAALRAQSTSPTRRADAPPVVVPTETVDHARTIDLGGGRQATVRFLGRAHTGGDLEVLVPQERVVFMSEAFISGIFPSMANGFPTEWVAMLDAAAGLDVDVVVPAHGLVDTPPVTTKAAMKAYRDAVAQVVSEGTRLHGASVPVADAATQARFGGLASMHRFKENVTGALARVYAELDGTLPRP